MKRQELPNDLGQKIKKMRGNLSQAEFAKRVGISRSLVVSYESGERVPSLDSLEKLANYGKVSIDHLLGIENAPSHKLTPEAESMLRQLLHKSSPEYKLPTDILMYLLLIAGLIIYLKYLGIC